MTSGQSWTSASGLTEATTSIYSLIAARSAATAFSSSLRTSVPAPGNRDNVDAAIHVQDAFCIDGNPHRPRSYLL